MNIAIVISSFAESSLSLAHALSQNGHKVDVYICIYHREQNCLPGIDFETSRRLFGKIYEVDYKRSLGVKWCEKQETVHVYINQLYPTGQNSHGLKKILAYLFFKRCLRNFCKYLIGKNYDVIEIVTQHPVYNMMSDYLKGQKIVRSFHEVLKNHMCNSELDPCLEMALRRKEHVRVFSQKSYDDVITNLSVKINSDQINIIPFGLFYNYLDYPDIRMQELNKFDDYVLYLGSILPYKGLSYMYEAVEILNNRGFNIKVVVAGKGYDECLEKIKKDNNFILINRFLSNVEVVNLIRHCKFIVCPYLSVSQSGIPQTAFVFNKPVIASDLGTFSDLIESGKTGLLVPPKNVEALVHAIKELYCNDMLYNYCVNNLRGYDQNNKDYNWKRIVGLYEDMIRML